jgi:hypothetical protein
VVYGVMVSDGYAPALISLGYAMNPLSLRKRTNI